MEALVDAPATRIARVAVDVPLAHLDRLFDYRLRPEHEEQVQIGCRVRVRFAGRLVDGFVLELPTDSEHQGQLSPIHAVVSSEPVLTPEVARLVRAVADHYAGSFADVVRLAVPPRHATTEKAKPVERNAVDLALAASRPHPLAAYPTGTALLDALATGASPRAAWQVVPTAAPVGDADRGLVAMAVATMRSGRGALIIVPDARDVARLAAVCHEVLGPTGFVTLTADVGPAARYRAFLAVLRGHVQLAIGTRAAAFAPMPNLGFVGLLDDGDDLLAEPRAPYPHAREVLAIRSTLEHCGFVIASYSRTVEVEQWVARDWLRPLALPPTHMRREASLVRVAAHDDRALERDPAAHVARLPRDAFTVMRAALAQGPVLVQVPRAGYQLALQCQQCRTPVACTACAGPCRADNAGMVVCTRCGRPQTDWHCAQCHSQRWRAPVVGADRTAEELGRAFAQVRVRRSSGERVLDDVTSDPALIVATPGAEPPVVDGTGYAAAILLDVDRLLARVDLRAGEEALRRWLAATALVRPAAEGGTVLVVGDPSDRVVQALVRLDPAGFAHRELAERSQAGLPPAVVTITLSGRSDAVRGFSDVLAQELGDLVVQWLGPVPQPSATDEAMVRTVLFGPAESRTALVAAVKHTAAIRAARKDDLAVRVVIDPRDFG